MRSIIIFSIIVVSLICITAHSKYSIDVIKLSNIMDGGSIQQSITFFFFSIKNKL